MKTIGVTTTVATALVVAGVLAMGLQSMPDIRRYLRMRSM